MRKLLAIAAGLAALIWSAAAWAVVKQVEVTITSGGTPVSGATVTLSSPKPPAAQVSSLPPKRTPRAAARTDSKGTTTVVYDDEDAKPGWTVDVTIHTRDGETQTVRGVQLSALVSGVPLNIAQGAPASTPFRPGEFYIPGTDTPLMIGGYVRHLESGVGDDAGLGVVFAPPIDPYFLRFANRIPVTGAQGEVMINRGTWWQTFGVSFARGSERTSASDDGTNNIGYVPNDPNLGAGNLFGLFPASATGKVSLTDIGLIYKAMQPFNLQNGFAWGWGPTPDEAVSLKMLGGIYTFDYRGLDYSGHLQRDADPNNVFVDVSHDLDTIRFMAGPAFYGERRLGNGWFLHGKADVQGGIMHSSLDTHETACIGCGGVNPNQSSISDSKTSFAWSASAQVGVGYQWTPNLKFVAGVEGKIGNRHVLDTRRNPNDDGTGIGTSTEEDLGAFFKFVYMSDVRLKRDIEQVGRLANGIALYRYRYLWSDMEYVGVLAQEAAEAVPEAVARGADGYFRVDYGRLGTRLMTWDEWRGPTPKEMAKAAL